MKFNDMVRSLQGHKNNTDYSKMNKSDDFYCERCDRRVSEDNIYDTNRGYICGDCFDELESNGDNVHERASTRKSQDGYCDVCNTYNGNDLTHTVISGCEELDLCESCYEETAECWFCHDIYFKDELNRMADGDDYLCENCYQALISRGEEVAVLRSTHKIKKYEFDGIDDIICVYLQNNGPSTMEEIASDEFLVGLGVDVASRLQRLVDLGEITYDDGMYSPIYPIEESMKKNEPKLKSCHIFVNGEEYVFPNIRDAQDFVNQHIEEAMFAMKGTEKLRELFDYELGGGEGGINSDDDIVYWAHDIADRMMDVAGNMPHEPMEDFGDDIYFSLKITDDEERQWFADIEYMEVYGR